MPWWLGIVFYGLRAVGWVIGIPGMIARWQAKRQGEAQQRAADDAVSLKQAEQANAVETDVARDSHQQLIDELQRFSRDA